MKKELISQRDIKKAVEVLRAVNHPIRQKIVHLLEKKDKLTVSEIFETLGIAQTVCSNHLAILRETGIIEVEKAGSKRVYNIVPSRINDINTYSYYLSSLTQTEKV